MSFLWIERSPQLKATQMRNLASENFGKLSACFIKTVTSTCIIRRCPPYPLLLRTRTSKQVLQTPVHLIRRALT